MKDIDYGSIFSGIEERSAKLFEEDRIRAENIASKGNFSRGLSSGIDNLQGSAYGTVGLLGDAAGIDSVRDWGFQGYQENQREAGLNPVDVPGFTDISTDKGLLETASDTGKWFAGTIGQLAPSVAESLVTTIIGAAAGSATVPIPGVGTAAGATAGLFGRKLAIKVVDDAVDSLIARGVTKEVAEKTVQKNILERAGAAAVGGNIGMVAGTAVQEGGQMWGEDAAEHGVENANAGSAAALSLVSSVSETVSPGGMLIKRIAGIKGTSAVADKVADTFLKRLGTSVPEAMGGEAAQEVFQSFLGVLNKKIQDPNVELADRKAIYEYVNSGMAGAAGGLVFGGANAVFPEKQAPPPTDITAHHTVDDVINEHSANIAVDSAIARQDIRTSGTVKDPMADTVPGVMGEQDALTITPRTDGQYQPVEMPGQQAGDISRLDIYIKGMANSLYQDQGGKVENPPWLKLKTLKAWEKETGEAVKSYVGPASARETLSAVIAGKPLTEKQVKVWSYLKSVAENMAMIDEQEAMDQMAGAGDFGPGFGQSPATQPADTRPKEPGPYEPEPGTSLAIQAEDAAIEADDERFADMVNVLKGQKSIQELNIAYSEMADVFSARPELARYADKFKVARDEAAGALQVRGSVRNESPVRTVVENPESAAAGQEVDTPTPAMAEAGNYKHAHVKLDGMDISVENPAGSVRSGTDKDGKTWQSEMKADYGYIKGSVGYDKDHVDVFMAPGYQGGAKEVFVVNQHNKDGKFDEHKVIIGPTSENDAMSVYNSNYEAGWTGGKSVVRMPIDEFKAWAKSDAPKKGAVKKNTVAPATEGVGQVGLLPPGEPRLLQGDENEDQQASTQGIKGPGVAAVRSPTGAATDILPVVRAEARGRDGEAQPTENRTDAILEARQEVPAIQDDIIPATTLISDLKATHGRAVGNEVAKARNAGEAISLPEAYRRAGVEYKDTGSAEGNLRDSDAVNSPVIATPEQSTPLANGQQSAPSASTEGSAQPGKSSTAQQVVDPSGVAQGAASVKEPWEMTESEHKKRVKSIPIEQVKAELVDALMKNRGFDKNKAERYINIKGGDKSVRDLHNAIVPFDSVELAIKQGKPVPAEVIADYPSLKPQPPKANDNPVPPLPPSQQATLDELTPQQRRILASLERKGILRISNTPPNATDQAMYLNGKVTVYLQNIQSGNLWSVIAHDIGEHVGHVMQSDQAYQRLLESLESRKDEQSSTGDAIRAAMKRIPENTRPEHRQSELLAYIIEEQSHPGIVRRFMAIVKNLLVKMGISPSIFTAADLRALAEAAVVRAAGRESGGFDLAGAINSFAQPAMMSVKEAARKIQGMEAFRAWFGNSVVTVDGKAGGEPLVVYHGTLEDFKAFDINKSVEGGMFFSPSGETASEFTNNEANGRVIPAYLSIKNPKILADKDIRDEDGFLDLEVMEGQLKKAKEQKHDGVIIKDMLDVDGNIEDQYVAFSPYQIKSIWNSNWSPTNPDIMMSAREAVKSIEPMFSVADTANSPLSLESLEEQASNPGTVRFIKGLKPDSTFLDRVFSTPEYYFKKFAAAGRVLQAALLRRDIRHIKEQEILGGFVKFVQDLRKTNKPAYDEANNYLLDTDRTTDGFRIKYKDSGNGTWQVISPEWAVKLEEGGKFTKERAVIAEFVAKDTTDEAQSEAEQQAVDAMIGAEGEAMGEQGYTVAAREAVRQARELTNRGFNVMAADMRRIISEAKASGLPDPFIGDGKLDEAGRYGIYAEGNKKPIALFASEKEAAEMLARAAEMISYIVTSKKKGKKSFKSELAAKRWASRHSGTVKGEKAFANLSIRKRSNADMRPLTVRQALAQMGDLRGIYFPRIRESGEYVLIAKKDGENPIRKHFDIPTVGDDRPTVQKLLAMATPIGREAKRLKLRGYDVTISKDTSPAEDVFEATNLMTTIDSLLQSAMGGVNPNDSADLKAAQHINQILTMQIADIFKSRGYLSSRMKRLAGDVVWEGYETDMGKALTQYGKNIGAGTAKRDTARAMVLAFSGRDYTWGDFKRDNPDDYSWDEYQKEVNERRIDERTQKNLFRDVRGFMIDVLRNDEQADRIIGTLKGLAVIKYMGFRVSSAAVNMTNMVQGVPATISGLLGEPIHTALSRVTKAAVAYGKYRTGKGGVSDDDRKIFEEISRRGWDEAQFNHEAASELRGKLGEHWNKFTTASMFMFGAAEKANRATTIFAAYKAAEESGLEGEAIWEKAKEVSDRAHGVYGKETIPAWARGKYNVLRLTYTFQKFVHNYMLNMLDLGFNRKEYKAAAYLLLSPAILAGSAASLAGPIFFAAVGALGVGGDDPEEEWYKWAEETFGGGTFARHGLFGMAGINIKGSLQINNPMPTTLAELAGPVGGIFDDIKRGTTNLLKGELAKGVESLLPTAFGSMSKSIREATEGITTSNYGTVFYGDEPLKSDAADAFIRFLSFNPARTSGIREMQWNEKEVAARYQEEKTEIYAQIKKARLNGDGITPEILKTIKEYNDRVFAAKRADIKPITQKGIVEMLKRNRKASRIERMRKTS